VIRFIITIFVVGLIAAFLARVLVPGRDHMTVGATILLGIVGSFVGGFLGYALFGKDLSDGAVQSSGIIGSIIGAVIVLVVYNAVTHRNGHSRRQLRA
jgi:uncharacterized membrane protein YeaQ/YmgE (transglycosylase-associated protein family)